MQRINLSLSRTGLLMATLLVLLYILSEWLDQGFGYSRSALQRGVFWPAITGHFDHLSLAHLTLNALATYLIIDAFESSFVRWRLPAVIVLLCLGISAGLYFLYPEVRYYAGFSGVLHGLIIIGAAWSLRYPPWIRWLVIGLVLGKVIWEQTPYYREEAIAGFIGVPVIEQAHLLGAVTAIAILMLHRLASAFIR